MSKPGASPIFHLSVPVRNLDEAVAFYCTTLAARPGRRTATWADVALFGAQITLQLDPANVPAAMPRTRHFGATLSWRDWERLVTTVEDFIEPPTLAYRGTHAEQAKAMIADPSGNLVELKAYRHPEAVLGALAHH